MCRAGVGHTPGLAGPLPTLGFTAFPCLQTLGCCDSEVGAWRAGTPLAPSLCRPDWGLQACFPLSQWVAQVGFADPGLGRNGENRLGWATSSTPRSLFRTHLPVASGSGTLFL